LQRKSLVSASNLVTTDMDPTGPLLPPTWIPSSQVCLDQPSLLHHGPITSIGGAGAQKKQKPVSTSDNNLFATATPISYANMHVIAFAGMRGAVSFSLAYIFPDDHNNRYGNRRVFPPFLLIFDCDPLQLRPRFCGLRILTFSCFVEPWCCVLPLW
jgi:hypothetical protein